MTVCSASPLLVLASAIVLPMLATDSRARDVGDFGGRGGGEFRITCEPGDFLVGFDVMATHVIDRIAPVCGHARQGGTYGRQWIGGNAGTLHKPRCQPGAILTILHVFADKTPLVNRLGFTCWHPGTGAVTNSLPDYGGVAGNNQRLMCARGEVATGIYGRAGTAIDRLGLICDKWPLTGASPSPNVASVPPEWAEMLNAHNEKRRLHCAPPLVWSAQLAAAAQEHANKCTNTHGVSSGENLATAMAWDGAGRDILPAKSDRNAYLESWYCEVKQYDFNKPGIVGGFTQNCAPPVNGHFTQVVWKSTQRVGCARQTCPMKDSQGKQRKGTYWVCRYDPPGNITSDAVLRQNVLRATCS